MFDEKLDNIRSMIAKMALTSQKMLENSIKSIIEKDGYTAEETILQDREIDILDNEIEETCFKMLAIYNPRAFDLRFVISSMRISIDLERIGDSCVNIAKQVKYLSEPPKGVFMKNIQTMKKEAYDMLKDSIKAFFDNDVHLALTTIKRDDVIDNLHKEFIKEIAKDMSDTPKKVQDGVSLIYVVRNIERIADHATNICEFVYFKQTGKSIKHTYFDKVKEVMENG